MSVALTLVGAAVRVGAQGPVPERNVNVIGGPTFLTYDPLSKSAEIAGDPWRNQQVEPFCDISTRNPAVIVCSAVDFRLVDLPGGADGVHHDSWNMMAQSPDGGTTWSSTLHPGHPLDPTANVLSKYDFAADPIVRAGAAGLFYHAGLVADRPTSTPNPDGAIYVSTWIHLNDREDDPAPVKMVRGGLTEAVTGNAGQFRDRPHLAVGEPNGETCTFEVDVTRYDDHGNVTVETVTQTVPATPAYLAFTTFVGQEHNTRSKIHFMKTDDCGQSWTNAIKLSAGNGIYQAPQIVKFPRSNRILVFWRLGQRPSQLDAIAVVRSDDEGQTFTKPRILAEICPFDQSTSATTFRTKTVPSAAADENRAYAVWAERPWDADGRCTMGDARIVMMTTEDGEEATTSRRVVVDPYPGRGHQIIANVAVSAGQVHVAWLDFRNDASGIFERFVDEAPIVGGQGENRHTADMRATEAPGQAVPVFPASQQISRYVRGIPYGETEDRQLQWNVVNARNFDRMRVVFNGDYNVIAAESLVPRDPLQPSIDGQTQWVVNGMPGSPPLGPVFLRFWTDSRNMKLLSAEDHSQPRAYTPPDLNTAIDPDLGGVPLPPESLFDPTRARPLCDPDLTGTKNLEIYSSRSTHGFYAFAPWNNKTLLGPDDDTGELVSVQRAFPIVVQNTLPATDESGSPQETEFRLTIVGPEPKPCPRDAGPGCLPELASFEQFSVQSDGTTLPEDPAQWEEVIVRAGSAVSRTVYVMSPRPQAAVRVDVERLESGVGTGEVRAIFLNPDPSAPPNLKKPGTDDGAREQFDIARYEVHELTISDIEVQDINLAGGTIVPLVADQGPEDGTPGWRNPGWRNPGWRNPGWRNPGWRNPGWRNPGWRNPGWRNPGWRNPGWRNPGISDATAGGSRQIRAEYTNTGNTTSSYDARVLVRGLLDPSAYQYQLVVYKLYTTTPDDGCGADLVGNSQVLVNVPDYEPTGTSPPSGDTSFSLHPGETAYVVLVVTSIRSQAFPTAFTQDSVTFAGAPQALDTAVVEGLPDGTPVPSPDPVVVPVLGITTSSLPDGALVLPYAATLQATGGLGSYAWSVIAGNLPAGLNLDAGSGEISGIPSSTGPANFTVEVRDSDNPPQVVTRSFTIQVHAVAVVAPMDLSPSTGIEHHNANFNETRAIEVEVLARGGVAVRAMTLRHFRVGAGTAILGARIYANDGTLVAGVDGSITTPGSDRALTIPIWAVLAEGEIYRVGFHLATDPYGTGAIDGLDPAPLGAAISPEYTDPTGFLRVRQAWQNNSDSFPDTPNSLVPFIEINIETGLAFLIEPTSTAPSLDITPTVQVQLVDESYAPVPSESITLSLYDNPTGAVLSGDLSVMTTAYGQSAFAPLSVDRPGGCFTLRATSGALEAFSRGFNITGIRFGPSMSTARTSAAVAPLPGGRVLVAGGSDTFELASAELYNPATGLFESTGGLGDPRTSPTAVSLSDGGVLVSGGIPPASAGTPLYASSEVYDPVAGSFAPSGDMTTPRYLHTMTRLPDDRVLVTGGEGVSGELATAEVYDPTTGVFEATGAMSTARSRHTATLLPDGRVLVVGGLDGAASLASAEIFNPTVGLFTPTVGGMTTARHLHTATPLADGRVLVVGGISDSAETPTAEIFDPATGLFSPTAAGLNQRRAGHTATALPGGGVLIAGGFFSVDVWEATVEIFDPSLEVFRDGPELGNKRTRHGAVALPRGDVLLVGGHNGNDGTLGSTEFYVPEDASVCP